MAIRTMKPPKALMYHEQTYQSARWYCDRLLVEPLVRATWKAIVPDEKTKPT